MHDFISEIVVFEEKVEGYRISIDKCVNPCLIIDRIDYSNLAQVISSIPIST